MNILHYSLGLPPYRSGGLTKYSVDLMTNQILQGEKVSLLFPGYFDLSKKRKVKKHSVYKNIDVYELINPIPVPLLGGINKPEYFMSKNSSDQLFNTFLLEINPDIIHVHTLMGLPKEFLEIIKEKGIKVIFTSHDYYGICPKVNLIDYKGNICLDYENGLNCTKCNKHTYSLRMIYFMQSRIYRLTKNSKLIKKLRESKKKSVTKLNNGIKTREMVIEGDTFSSVNFVKLRNYYCDMLQMVNLIHYNSQISKSVYEKYIKNEGLILPITHGDIQDKRIIKEYVQEKPLQIGFLGPLEEYKGFPLLRNALMKLVKEHNQTNWHLHVYGNNTSPCISIDESKFSFYGQYNHNELEKIFKSIDVLIIPSIWYETFGFIGLEAIANGVPCVVSEFVGFKDLVVDQQTGVIISANEDKLAITLDFLIKNRQKLSEFNRNICELPFTHLMNTHVKDIKKMYTKVLGDK